MCEKHHNIFENNLLSLFDYKQYYINTEEILTILKVDYNISINIKILQMFC